MTIAQLIAYIIAFVGGGSVLLCAVAWLIRTGLKHSMDRDLLEFKSRLETAANVGIERLRSELRVSETERGKQSTLLLERRAGLIDELYKKLIDYLAAAESFSSIVEWAGEPSKEEKAKTLSDQANAFFGFFIRHRIYFSSALCDRIRHLHETVREPMTRLQVWQHAVRDGDLSGGEFHDAWEKAAKTIQKDVPPLMTAIEEEFRSLLGVKDREDPK